MGGIFANYKEKNAIRLASSQGASITFLITLLYLVLLIAILFIPVSNYFYSLERGLKLSTWNLMTTSLILFILGCIITIASLRLGIKSFVKDV